MERGFTLIELMIVLSIVAVLSGIGYDAYTQVIPDLRATGAARAISMNVMAARAAAIRQNQEMVVYFDLQGGEFVINPDPGELCNALSALPGCLNGCQVAPGMLPACMAGEYLEANYTGTGYGIPSAAQPNLSRPYQFVQVAGPCRFVDTLGNASGNSNGTACAFRITSDGRFRGLDGRRDLTGYVIVLPQMDIGTPRCDRARVVMFEGSTGSVKVAYGVCP